MTERDAKDLVDWLDQAEEETKATIAEHERIDPFYDGVLSTVQTVREYIKKMRTKTHTTPQGTFPVFSLSPGKSLKEDVKKVLSEDIDIIAPSCGLAPKTPLANVKALVEARNEYFNI